MVYVQLCFYVCVCVYTWTIHHICVQCCLCIQYVSSIPHMVGNCCNMALNCCNIDVNCCNMALNCCKIDVNSCNMALNCCNIDVNCCNMALYCCNIDVNCCNMALYCYNIDVNCATWQYIKQVRVLRLHYHWALCDCPPCCRGAPPRYVAATLL